MLSFTQAPQTGQGSKRKEDGMFTESDRNQLLSGKEFTEIPRVRSLVRAADKASLIEFANRQCLPTYECGEPEELSLTELRESVLWDIGTGHEIFSDRLADARNSRF